MKARYVVVVLVAALAAYFVLIGYRGVYLLGQHQLYLKVLGGAVLALPVVGLILIGLEIRFGLATQRLASQLDAEGVADDIDAPRLASGRVDRDAADAQFAIVQARVEAAPEDWRGWYQLALAYDNSGDRKRARAAMRTAIERAS